MHEGVVVVIVSPRVFRLRVFRLGTLIQTPPPEGLQNLNTQPIQSWRYISRALLVRSGLSPARGGVRVQAKAAARQPLAAPQSEKIDLRVAGWVFRLEMRIQTPPLEVQ